jgi:hypothetical protein
LEKRTAKELIVPVLGFLAFSWYFLGLETGLFLPSQHFGKFADSWG